MHHPNGPSLLSLLHHRARENRRRATSSERKLWTALRMRKLGVRVRRQWVLAPYVVDFYVPAYRLVIEVDGGYHLSPEQIEADRHRESELVRLHDVRIVRFDAALVDSRPAAVTATLLEVMRCLEH